MSRDITAIPPIPAEQRIAYGNHPSQFFDLWKARDARVGVAMMIHGGFWRAKYDLTHASHLCVALAGAGFDVANVEYRRVGEVGGGWPGSLEDVTAGVRAVAKRFGGSPVVLGHSAGGHLALRVAAEDVPVGGVVALAPVADLQLADELNLSNGAVKEFLGVDPKEDPTRLREACASWHTSSASRILVHGTADDVVPLKLSHNFLDRRKDDARKVAILEVVGADHFDVIDPESIAWITVCGAVKALAQESSARNRSTNV